MDPEDIARLCGSLSLLEHGGHVQNLDEHLKFATIDKMTLCLVGKILSNKPINRDVFMRVIGRIWQVKKGLSIEFVTSNVFAFHFQDLEESQKVLSRGPWSFDEALMVLETSVGTEMIENMVFKHVDF